MTNIKYSIIIPHYNTPELLLRCVESIPEKDDIQVIVVDDNSPNADKYEKLYPQLYRKNVEIHLTKEGRGAGYARNIGLKYVTGKWVLFADSDDFYVKNFVEMLDGYYNSNADIIYFNIKSVMSDDVTKPARRNEPKNELFSSYQHTKDVTRFRYEYSEPWGKLIKSDFIKANNITFDETDVSNDYYFSVVSGCLAHKIIVVDKPLYVVTLRENSLSYKYGDTLSKLLIRLEVATRVQIFTKEHGYDINPMPIRGLMVLLLKKNPFIFFKYILVLKRKGISVAELLYQIFNPRYMTSKN